MSNPNLTQPRIHFFAGDTPFFWVRAGALRTGAARARGLHISVAFESGYPGGGCLPLFNRFCYGRLYRLLVETAIKRGVPYLADIDDLYWELPDYSLDQAGGDKEYVTYLDFLLGNAATIVCSTDYLRGRIAERFPKVRTALVENSPPLWISPPGSILIANTDSVKLPPADIAWFAPLLRDFWDAGIGIQLLGENGALESGPLEFRCHVLPRLIYRDYHLHLSTHRYRLGLIPVEDSSYAAAKSAIKIFEFVNHGIPVIASDIEPHRRFVRDHPDCAVTLVPNTAADWSRALAPYRTLSADEAPRGRAINATLHAASARQLEQWEEVLRMIPLDDDLSRRNRSIGRLLRLHAAYERLKPFIGMGPGR